MQSKQINVLSKARSDRFVFVQVKLQAETIKPWRTCWRSVAEFSLLACVKRIALSMPPVASLFAYQFYLAGQRRYRGDSLYDGQSCIV